MKYDRFPAALGCLCMAVSVWLEGTALRVMQIAGIGLLFVGFFLPCLRRKYIQWRKGGKQDEE